MYLVHTSQHVGRDSHEPPQPIYPFLPPHHPPPPFVLSPQPVSFLFRYSLLTKFTHPPPKKKPSLILNIDKYSNRLSRIGRPVQLQERHVKRLSDEGGGRQGS